MHPALLYLPGARLSLPELSAARLDGHVVDIGDAYIPADLLEAADVRAASVSALVQDGAAACGPTAAWIHGAGDAPPPVHHVKRCVQRRIRGHASARLVFHDTVLPEYDVVQIGGVPVSTPVRTMVDLATTLHRDPRMLPWMEALAVAQPAVTDGALVTLRRLNRVPGSRAGQAALARLALRMR